MTHQQDIVTRLWGLCNILRESGITYPEYVTELTYLLFLKMEQQTGAEGNLPAGFRWTDLSERKDSGQLDFYQNLLKVLGNSTANNVRAIFAGAKTALRKPKHLQLLISELDSINWSPELQEDTLGDIYEGLLEKNSAESKSGAGQYFTPRPVIDTIIKLVKPRTGEIVQDPACGTGGFLIAADRYIKTSRKSKNPKRAGDQSSFDGIELVRNTQRLALMNAMLHHINANIICGDALDQDGELLKPADLILTNPPFGTKPGAGLPDRAFPFPTSNKQLAFLQHIYLGLKPGGRAAVVLPDLQGRAATQILADLMDKCDLHTVLRLPVGIFYAQGVKTNVYFFRRGKNDIGNTKRVWIYDLRSNMTTFNKGNPLMRVHFAEFEKAFGSDPYGKSKRKDEGEQGRFRCFSRENIREQGDTLDIAWLVDDEVSESKSDQSPDALANQIMKRLESALKELRALQADAKRKD
jgi:type I restriction enzyme M protein